MTVSVVIPAYNRAALLPRALRSVARQTYADYELIVVDDGSTDETPAVVEEFARTSPVKPTYIRVDRNQGGAAARNAGVRAAQGRYIALLDADDEWRPEKLARQTVFFDQQPADVGLVTTSYGMADATGVVRAEYPAKPQSGDLSAAIIPALEGRYEVVGVFSTLMFRAAVFDRVGGLDETLPCWHDTDFYLRASQHFQFAFLADALTVKYDPPDAISAKWTVQGPGVRRFWDKYKDRYGARPAFRRRIAHHQHGLGMQACLAGHVVEGRRLFRESLAVDPRQWRSAVHLGLASAGARAYAGIVSARERLR